MSVKSLFGNIINFKNSSSFDHIPTRKDILNKGDYKKINNIINKHNDNPLLFMPNDIIEFHEKVNYRLEYRLLVFGILPDGRKAALIIEGFHPSFNIKKPDDYSVSKALSKIKEVIRENCNGYVPVEKIYKKGYTSYEFKESLHFLLKFSSSFDRTKTLKHFHNCLKEWKTTGDDYNHLERLICRENNFTWCGWNDISRFRSYRKETCCKLPKTFRIHYKKIIQYDIDFKNPNAKILSKDKSIIMTWDIETHTYSGGDVPDGNRPGDEVFAIGASFHYIWEDESFLDVCLISRPCAARNDKLTIRCNNEKDLIKAFVYLYKKFQPEFICGFNDTCYDWKFIIAKMNQYNLVLFMRDHFSLFYDEYSIKIKKKSINEQKRDVQWNYLKKSKIKLEAGFNSDAEYLKFPGFINIDARTMMRKKYPKISTTKLNFYLAMLKLGSKEDMPISEMFRIYRESIELEKQFKVLDNKRLELKASTTNVKKTEHNSINNEIKIITQKLKDNMKRMADVAHYCTIDAKKCQSIILKENIISDKREISKISHTTLLDAITYAGGMKVRNLIMAEGIKRNLVFSTKFDRDKVRGGKYPGAKVFTPIKGLVKPKLTIREMIKEKQECWIDLLDDEIDYLENFTYNNYDEIINIRNEHEDEKEFQYYIMEIIKKDNKLNRITKIHSPYIKFLWEQNKYPVSGLDFSSLYPSIIMTYNFSPECIVYKQSNVDLLIREGYDLHKIDFLNGNERVIAWSIRHNTYDGKTLKDGKKNNLFGLCPSILKSLFSTRKGMKAKMKLYAKEKEKLEHMNDTKSEHYDDTCFMYNYMNAKQKALKVFMNTFYGEMGNQISPFFTIAIAGGITSEGQRNIKMVSNIVTSNGCDALGHEDKNVKGCTRYYGDTDSVYISCPPRHFVKYDKEYYGGKISKLKYCTSLVEKTFDVIKRIKDIANNKLIEDNGTSFLKLAYEEVLFPVSFFKRKMYAGIPHEDSINFFIKPSEFFIKGMVIEKRDVAKLVKTVGYEILSEMFDINNIKSIMQIVRKKIKDVYARNWDLKDFIRTAMYRPNKNNIAVKTFRDRMIERNDLKLCPPPTAGERFNYVIVDRNYSTVKRYTLNGNKITLKTSDMWEYYSYVKEKKIPINLSEYIKGGVIGLLAQMVEYYPDFQIYMGGNENEDEERIVEKKVADSAKKYITKLCKGMEKNPECQGKIRKKIFRLVNSSYKKSYINTIKDSKYKGSFQLITNYTLNDTNIYESIEEIIEKKSEEKSIKYANDYIKNILDKKDNSLFHKLYNLYTKSNTSLLVIRRYHKDQVKIDTKKIFDLYKLEFKKLFNNRNDSIENVVNLLIGELNLENEENIPDHKILNENKNIIDIIKEGEEKNIKNLDRHKFIIELLYKTHNTLLSAITNYKTTEKIIELLKYNIEKNIGCYTVPPSVNLNVENEQAIEFIRNNLIDF